MYYSISDVSKQLKVSKVTIYKKIAKINGLKEHVKQLKEGKCITEEGIEIIKQSLQDSQFIKPLQSEFTAEPENIDFTNDLIVYKQLIETLENQNKELKQDKLKLYEQLEIKDNQIENLTRLTENSQKLLKQQQVLLLEEPEPSRIKSFMNIFKRK